VKCVHFIKRIH